MTAARQKRTRQHLAKPKLLLDEGLPPRQQLVLLNQNYNVKHIKNDYILSGLSDSAVYSRAAKEKRFLVTFNIKHFSPILDKEKPSIIAVSTKLSTGQIDLKLTSFLKRIKPSEYSGKMIKITGETKH